MTYRLNNIVDQLLCLVNFLFSICHDQAMQILFLVRSVSSVGASFAFLYGSLSTNSNFCTGFCFHFLQGVSTGPNQETNY